MKSIVLCADDYGLTASISEGILSLVEQRRLSAVSCMTCLPDWKHFAPLLKSFTDQTAIGLHFNLTESDTALPLGQLMLKSLSGGLDVEWIQDTLDKQLDDFEDQLGQAPDFIDGHQHVHIFPSIRQILFKTVRQRYPNHPIWLRRVNPALTGHDALLKAIVLHLMGLGWEQQASLHQCKLTQHFAGLYSLRPDANFASLLQSWMVKLPKGGLIMCHPGAKVVNAVGMMLTRQNEYDYLASDVFLETLNKHAITLTKTPAFL